jgi:hypothetical protein
VLLVRAVKKKGKCKVLQKSGGGGLEKELAVKKGSDGEVGRETIATPPLGGLAPTFSECGYG